MKQLILVLGMHRSGTSALTGLLNILNINLGSKLIGQAVENQKGFFENEHFLNFNKKLLRVNSSKWDNVSKSLYISTKEKKELKLLIETEFLNFKILAIKDPRLSILYPFYIEIARELNYEIHCIIVVRNVKEIVESLKHRNKFTEEKCYKLISEYYYSLLNAPEHSITIKFDDIIDAPLQVCEKLISKFSLNASIETVEIDINNFIDKNLKHYNFD